MAMPLPRLERRGNASQLIVDGAPYLALGGELHNSSSSSPAYMEHVWEHLAAVGLRTVVSPVTWQLIEPEEGVFDFSTLDAQLLAAREHGIRIVLLWFGAYKNAESSYAPSWVRRDESRFPRATRDPERLITGRFTLDGPILSAFCQELVAADARAFSAVMAHLREEDPGHTVITVQVQNEVGLLGDSRDRSSLAQAAWESPVPPELIQHLAGLDAADGASHAADLWRANGAVREGTWERVFGASPEAEEIFMAFGFARYVERVAAAGRAEKDLPLYANAWLGPQPNATVPGAYPSGGPVARMADVWRAGAPTLDLLAPDIYIDDFAGTLASYAVRGNPIFVPEARPDAALAFRAVGSFDAVCFSPFGIEDLAADHEVFGAFAALGSASAQILDAQSRGAIHGFRLGLGASETVSLGGYEVSLNGPFDTRGMFGAGTGSAAEELEAHGVLLQLAEDEFLAIAKGASLRFARPDAAVELDLVQEGEYVDGAWVPGRTLNGDERYFMFPSHGVRTVKICLLRRAA